MKTSQLAAIISRLEAMIESKEADQTRRFEKNGEQKGLVTYDSTKDTFELEEYSTHQKFEFDDIDLAALEIYDLLNS